MARKRYLDEDVLPVLREIELSPAEGLLLPLYVVSSRFQHRHKAIWSSQMAQANSNKHSALFACFSIIGLHW